MSFFSKHFYENLSTLSTHTPLFEKKSAFEIENLNAPLPQDAETDHTHPVKLHRRF